MAVWKPRCSAKGLDLGVLVDCGLVGLGLDGPAEMLSGERVGVLGGVRVGELSGDGELRGDWQGDCWGESWGCWSWLGERLGLLVIVW